MSDQNWHRILTECSKNIFFLWGGGDIKKNISTISGYGENSTKNSK